MRRHFRKISVFLIVAMAVTMIPVNVHYAAGNDMTTKTADMSHIPTGLVDIIKSNTSEADATGAAAAEDETLIIDAKDVIDLDAEEGTDSAYDDPEIAEPEFYGYIGEEIELDFTDAEESSDWGAASIPSSYDMRTKSYASKIAVKNQQETGLCWAFSTTTAAEINYYHTYGANASAKTFSPLAIGYFTYNKVSDPLGLTSGDKNIVLHGKTWKSVGGSNSITMNMLSGYMGLISESSMPFSNRNQSSYNSNLGYNSNDMTVKDVHMLNYKDRNSIKQAIMNYGSVISNIYMGDPYTNYVTNGVYKYSHQASNHLVTIIGWSDSMGAWLVQNSWGSNWDGDGCFWVSYNDPSMTSMMAVEVQPAGTYKLNYHYDGSASYGSRGMNKGTRAANIFTARNDGNSGNYQLLEAVGLTTHNTGYSTYKIDIYTGCSANNPTSGTRAASFTASTSSSGYHTLKLPYVVEIPDGQRYSIVITFNQFTYLATDEPGETGGSIQFSPSNRTGQSFWSGNTTGAFNDFAKLGNGCCARIKCLVNEPTARVENSDYYKLRHEGTDRVQTAAMVNNNVRALEDINKWNTTIIAYGLNFPDALAGSYLSKVNGNAPIMLVYNVYENAMVTYIKNTVNSGGKIYILGGTSVISSKFERDLRANGYNVKRLAGSNRYETNLAVLREAGVSNQELMVCSGNGYADSLSASAVGKPILLVDKSLSSSQQSYLNSIGSKKAFLIGGTGAVSSTVESQLKSRGYTTSRFAGSNRYQTSAMVANYFFGTKAKSIVLAYGMNFPDGLSGGPLALRYNAPLLLADNNKNNVAYIKDYVHDLSDLLLVHVLGGTGLISDSMVRYISK